MTSEPDGSPRRRPPTIDLTATEVETAKQASEQEAGPSDQSHAEAVPGRGRHLGRHAIAATAGAIVMAAILGGLWYAGYVSIREPNAPPITQATKSTIPDDVLARLDKLEASQRVRPQPDAGLGSRVGANEAAIKTLEESLASVTHRLGEATKAAQGAATQASAASSAADNARTAAQSGTQNLETLTSRIAALDNAVKALANDVARRTSVVNDRAGRLAVAAQALRAAVERGAPYQAELAAVKSFGVEPKDTAPLEASAAAGLPSVAALAQELKDLTPSLLQASSASPPATNFLRRIETSAQKLVRVRPIDAPAGDNPAAIIDRMNAAAARGDLASARAEISRLPESAKPLVEAWAKKIDARNAAIAASQRIAADAMAALAKPNTQ